MEKCYKLKGRLEIFLKERGLWDDFISRLNEMNYTFGEAIERVSFLPSREHRYAIKIMTSHYWVFSNDLRREVYLDFVSNYTTLPYKIEPDHTWDNMWEG